MAISVLFPDGSYAKVPAQLIGPRRGDGPMKEAFRQVPLNCDPHWLFLLEEGVWLAKPRHGPDVAHLPAREEPCWWEGIPQICDDIVAEGLSDAALKTAA